MSVPVIAFFNNKGGVGKTSLVYHVSCMLAEQGYRVVAADLDPQANLTTRFLDEQRVDELCSNASEGQTIHSAVQPLIQGLGEISGPVLERISERLTLIPGDISFSEIEDDLSQAWRECLTGTEPAYRLVSSLWKVIRLATDLRDADLALIDLAPNLGAINRTALIASDFIVIPVVADMFSVQGLRSLGSSIRSWRTDWQQCLARASNSLHPLPKGEMRPIGYVISHNQLFRNQPSRAHATWLNRLPGAYRTFVLGTDESFSAGETEDPQCLGILRHYRSLVPIAEETRKPMFSLNAADGAMGALMRAVQDAYADFKALSLEIAERAHAQCRQAEQTERNRTA